MEERENVKALAFAAKNGNEKCFEALYEAYYGKIYALCLATLKNAADAEDALQLTFISAWQNISSLEDAGAFNTWIQRIAVNQCYSILRKRKPDVSVEEEEETLDLNETEDELTLPGVYAERADLRERLKVIIDGLSEVQRQTVLLYYFNGLTVEEIAEVMNCGENTVKSRLMLARRSIKTEIEEKERKTGERFYGIAGIPVFPFANMFISQVRSTIIGKTAATAVFRNVFAALHPGTAVSVMANATATAGKAAALNNAAFTTTGKAAAIKSTTFSTASKAAGLKNTTASAAGKASAIKTGTAAAGNAAIKTGGVAAGSAAIKTGGVAAGKAALKTGGAAAGKGFLQSLAAKIIAAVVATGVVAGGTIGVVNVIKNNDETTESKPDLTEAYVAYIDLLTENKADIDAYYWQKDFLDEEETPADDELTRPVALCDFYGDSTPELIYAYRWSPMIAALRIVTYEDGFIKELFFEEEWDPNGAGGGSRTYLYRKYGDKTLYAFQSYGDMDWNIKYNAFESDGDGVYLSEKYYHTSDLMMTDDDHYDIERFYHKYWKDGVTEISEEEYNEAEADIQAETEEVLIYTAECGEFLDDFVDKNGSSAMTCDEAIEHLSAMIKTDGSQTEKLKYEFTEEHRDGYEYGEVNAINGSGGIAWTYRTDKYPETELQQITEIGVNGEYYYLAEGGKVICHDKLTGETVWEKGEVGCSNAFCFDKDGSLYITGYYGPDATKIDKNGEVLWSESYYDEGYMWPEKIELVNENRLRIRMTVKGSDTVALVYADTKTGSISLFDTAEDLSNDLFSILVGEYAFASGAGGWSNNIELGNDGTFTGEYYDTNYLNEESVEILCSLYRGRFADVKKVNDYTYSAQLVSLDYDTKPGTEKIRDNSDLLPGGKEIWRYTEAYGLENCKTVYFYLKGAPMSALPEEFVHWGYAPANITGEEDTLPVNGFYNTEEEYGFFESIYA